MTRREVAREMTGWTEERAVASCEDEDSRPRPWNMFFFFYFAL